MPKCENPDCEKFACFSISGSSGRIQYCSKCARMNQPDASLICDIWNQSKHCDSCSQTALYAESWGVRAKWCHTHKDVFDINVNEKMCSVCAMKPIYASDCCKFCSNLEPPSKEYLMAKHLITNLNGIEKWMYNRSLGKTVRAYRPDLTISPRQWRGLIFIEFDEKAHGQRDPKCEIRRMLEIFKAHNQKIVFIRYNHDAYNADIKELTIDVQNYINTEPDAYLTIAQCRYPTEFQQLKVMNWVDLVL